MQKKSLLEFIPMIVHRGQILQCVIPPYQNAGRWKVNYSELNIEAEGDSIIDAILEANALLAKILESLVENGKLEETLEDKGFNKYKIKKIKKIIGDKYCV